MGTPQEDKKRAINALRNGATVPPEASPLVANLLEKHMQMNIGPDAPEGWLKVDRAGTDLARAVIEGLEKD
ncbi:hypothetical protein LH612_37195 [Klebsiella pneumoniae]|nr:hypothetical protein [Klebsiella pneumoniae]